MFRIVFATDGSAASAEALQLLKALPLPNGTALHILTVYIGWSLPVAAYGEAVLLDPAVVEAERDHATKVALAATRELEREGLTITSAVVEGQPAYQILMAAAAFDADLVVVGSHGLTGLAGLVLGSVARSVLHHAGCSVLIAHPPIRGLRSVVLALDDSQHASEALEFTAGLPLPAEAHIRVVNVIPAHWKLVRKHRGTAAQEASSGELADAPVCPPAQRLVDDACVRLGAAGKQATGEVREGDPATEIRNVASDCHADLIIVGARGGSLIRTMLLGSVPDRLLKSPTCSVLVVRDGTALSPMD